MSGLSGDVFAHVGQERAQPDPYPGDGGVEGQQDGGGYEPEAIAAKEIKKNAPVTAL